MERVQSTSGFPGVISLLGMGGCFLLGGIAGCLFSWQIDGERFAEIQQYLTDYLDLVSRSGVEWSFGAVVWNQGRWLLVCVLLGLSWLGVLLFPCLFGIRGFLMAFGAGCFVRGLSGNGVLLALLLFGLPAVLWAPGFFWTGLLCAGNSFRLLRRGMGETAPVATGRGAIRRCVLMDICMTVACGILECSLLPVLLRSAVRILG